MQGPKWPFLLILIGYEPDVVMRLVLGQVLYLGSAPRTKETLPDFYEWCRVTRHPRVFRVLTGCQRTPQFWGVTLSLFKTLETSRDPMESILTRTFELGIM